MFQMFSITSNESPVRACLSSIKGGHGDLLMKFKIKLPAYIPKHLRLKLAGLFKEIDEGSIEFKTNYCRQDDNVLFYLE